MVTSEKSGCCDVSAFRIPQVSYFRHGGCYSHCHELRHCAQRVFADAHNSCHIPAAAPRESRGVGRECGERGVGRRSFELIPAPALGFIGVTAAPAGFRPAPGRAPGHLAAKAGVVCGLTAPRRGADPEKAAERAGV